ncbi:nitrilase-related carbon-nitrogen hydrolase [Nostocoides vanveenii]|uniref:Carbon-nitrogen family hydrolase n=1 Tax=Nostocoides vanveenii TaxID=330835 RepID=A0ABN2KA36_9MICO
MKVAVIQLAYDDHEPMAERVARAADLVRAQRGHDLVILPELWPMTGFDYRRWDGLAEALDLESVGEDGNPSIVAAMARAARDAGVLLHMGSLVERLKAPGPEGHSLSNTSVVLSPAGDPVAIYRKVHRFGFGSGEPKLMEAGTEPLARVGLHPEGATAMLSTCYDLRFPELYRRQVSAGAEVFLVPAAWPAARIGHWSLLGRARAIENQCVLIACNTAGTHAGYEMGGRSQVVSSRGEVLAEAGAGQEVLSVDVDLADMATYRQEFPVLADRRL